MRTDNAFPAGSFLWHNNYVVLRRVIAPARRSAPDGYDGYSSSADSKDRSERTQKSRPTEPGGFLNPTTSKRGAIDSIPHCFADLATTYSPTS